MKAYIVGGAVRDQLLGLPVRDRDWVVVGARPEDLLAQGFRPVGKDFPVFLHPETQEEYALARTERKTAPGYKGFVFHAAPDVTLEEDLVRRDLTINAIARGEDGTIVDPHHGRADLEARVLRHVSAAFAEDPVRILRVARFAARFADFSVAPETLALMSAMVAADEVDALVPERVWQELARGLMEARPSRMFEVLRACGALARILPELDALWGVPQRPDFHPEVDTGVHMMLVVDMAARIEAPLAARFAALGHDLGKGGTPAATLPRHSGHEARSVALLGPLCQRLRVPAECRDLALLVARHHGEIHRCEELRASTVVRILERCDALRRPERFEQLLLACEADYRGRQGFAERPYLPARCWRQALAAVRAVDAGALARACAEPARIPQRINEARVATVRQLVRSDQISLHRTKISPK
ncbi:multifunctional CCA tRNA nucleotidyl transferase/2'3'-cyclic phosphodiesterase/2'nucleotidase/phosphatase [Denitratisoma sp. DHT3]|uniref:multifunctional CCA addition/repair protein n=1 Tax=Denitratisoma sp. DHT3 TaxID=1981880 RepID=UPI001198AB4F|nr:multifunctional CCA addition/repair protein [Denitratisoma sp. DHT3]QDX82183.1 multifunctional CCA tRNA nucleotidyl transferase/2'3'-cyclic phosphodiesterase/2'nucleotidase/phosphatase [Denitratisoma sp. DHT3]